MAERSDAARINEGHGGWEEETIPLEVHSLYTKILPFARALPPGDVIEVGCGAGRFLSRLQGEGWNVKGLELLPQMAEFIEQCDASLGFPVADDSCDLLIAAEVVEHVVDTEKFLAECHRVLRPNGTLIITTPNLLFSVNRLRMLVGMTPLFAYADFHVRMFVPSDFKSKVSQQFAIQAVIGSHVLIGRHRAPRLGAVSAWLGTKMPNLSAHLIIVAEVDIAD